MYILKNTKTNKIVKFNEEQDAYDYIVQKALKTGDIPAEDAEYIKHAKALDDLSDLLYDMELITCDSITECIMYAIVSDALLNSSSWGNWELEEEDDAHANNFVDKIDSGM